MLVSPALANAPGPTPIGIPTESRALESALSLGMHCIAVGVLVLLWWRGVLRPASLRAGTRKVDGLPAGVWFASAGVLFFASPLGGSLALSLPERLLGAENSLQRQGIMQLAAYGCAACVIATLVYLLLPRAPAAGLRPRAGDAPRAGGAFLLTLPVVLSVGALASAAAYWITGEPPDAIAHSTLAEIREQRHNPWVAAVIAGAVLGAPLWEEFTYRVFLQSGLARVLKDRLLAVVLASVAFALVHRVGASPVPWHAVVAIFVLGLSCGIAYERTGRPGVPVLMHALFNAFNIAWALFVM